MYDSGPKWPICAEQLFQYKSLLLSSTYQHFSLCKILKKLIQGIQSYEDAPFLRPKWSIWPNKDFFGKNYLYHFHLLIEPFHCAKSFKKSYSGFRVMRMRRFWAQNGPFTQMRTFSENRLISLVVPFIHAYRHAKNQSQILI